MIKSYEQMLEQLKAKTNFSWSRWGDGEWQCVLGCNGANCDGHNYYKSLGERLEAVLLSKPKYDIAVQAKAVKDMGWDIRNYLKENELQLEWGEADILHNASTEGRMTEFWEAMRGRKVLSVGTEARIVALNKCNKHDYLFLNDVPVPEKNCWLCYEGIKYELARWTKMNDIILYSASMMSKVLIDDMYQMFGDTITQIDCGSVFAPYCGHSTRKYHKQIIERIDNEQKAQSSGNHST